MQGERTRVTGVGIRLDGTFGDFEVILVGDLVQGVLAAAEELAGIAVAGGDVSVTSSPRWFGS